MLGSGMDDEQQAGAVELDARLRGVSPPVTRRIWIGEQASLAELHAVLQVTFGWSDEHLCAFQIRGWQFGDPSRAIELALAGGGVDDESRRATGERAINVASMLHVSEEPRTVDEAGVIRQFREHGQNDACKLRLQKGVLRREMRIESGATDAGLARNVTDAYAVIGTAAQKRYERGGD
jgi:hypothetical protein